MIAEGKKILKCVNISSDEGSSTDKSKESSSDFRGDVKNKWDSNKIISKENSGKKEIQARVIES